MRLPPGLLALAVALPATAQEMVPATLAGHAVLPAMTISAPPPDAPPDASISGKFTSGANRRVNEPMNVEQRTGIRLPFLGQPFQGISGFATERGADGAIRMLIDNGFGTKANSPDAMLSYALIRPDFETGAVEILDRVWLRDPNHVVPFRIAYQGTESRYLTGADFDPESLQVVGDEIWIGEEFGPYLISATLDGAITGVYPTLLEGAELRSPDHPALRIPAAAGTDWRVPRSGGFEGMALTPAGDRLWAMLEKPLLAEDGAAEGDFLRVLAFDPARRAWTGESFRFRLTEGAVAIGDFNFVDDTRALVIERDGGEGDPGLACAEGETEGCFRNPARVKRVTLIDTSRIDADGFVARLRQIDLMDIADPDKVARGETSREGEGRFTFPFVTIESVIRDGDDHILVGNDNNLPFSMGRRLGAADANEIIRLHVPAFFAAE